MVDHDGRVGRPTRTTSVGRARARGALEGTLRISEVRSDRGARRRAAPARGATVTSPRRRCRRDGSSSCSVGRRDRATSSSSGSERGTGAAGRRRRTSAAFVKTLETLRIVDPRTSRGRGQQADEDRGSRGRDLRVRDHDPPPRLGIEPDRRERLPGWPDAPEPLALGEPRAERVGELLVAGSGQAEASSGEREGIGSPSEPAAARRCLPPLDPRDRGRAPPRASRASSHVGPAGRSTAWNRSQRSFIQCQRVSVRELEDDPAPRDAGDRATNGSRSATL